jgi:hypothetical protein
MLEPFSAKGPWGWVYFYDPSTGCPSYIRRSIENKLFLSVYEFFFFAVIWTLTVRLGWQYVVNSKTFSYSLFHKGSSSLLHLVVSWETLGLETLIVKTFTMLALRCIAWGSYQGALPYLVRMWCSAYPANDYVNLPLPHSSPSPPPSLPSRSTIENSHLGDSFVERSIPSPVNLICQTDNRTDLSSAPICTYVKGGKYVHFVYKCPQWQQTKILSQKNSFYLRSEFNIYNMCAVHFQSICYNKRREESVLSVSFCQKYMSCPLILQICMYIYTT